MIRTRFETAIRRLAVGACVAVVFPSHLSATLGGDATSVDLDRAKMKAALVGIARNGEFAVHQLQSATGTAIREYVSSAGTVFAVSWEGPWMPDLQQMLGPYFDAYQQAAPAVRRGRRAHGPMTVRAGDLVVQLSGHPRAFHGRAYVERLLPAGVQADAIR